MLFRDMINYILGDGLFKAAKKLGLTSGKTLVIGSDEEQIILEIMRFLMNTVGNLMQLTAM